MRTILPQGGYMHTEGPFRMVGIQGKTIMFNHIEKPEEGTHMVNIGDIASRCGWTLEDFQKARRNMKYFHHHIHEKGEEYTMAISCWSEGKYTYLKSTPLLRRILKSEKK